VNRERMLQNPLPIDRVAARVVRGKREHWTPGICQRQPYWDVQPPVRPVPWLMKRNPSFTDWTGYRYGRFTVVGMHAEAKSGEGKSVRWVARCSCGNYVLFRSNAFHRHKVDDANCPRCEAKRKILGVLDKKVLE
jgi:hypothetical protein